MSSARVQKIEPIEVVPRIPRYSLVADDDGRVRMAQGTSLDGPIIEGLLVNLSATGAMIALRETVARIRFLDEGEMIKIELAIPERGRFAFFATVVRLEPSRQDGFWELGLMFRNLPSSLTQALDRYVTTRSKDYSHPENFDFAAAKGFQYAAARLTPARLMALTQTTLREPLWWASVFAFAFVGIVPILVPIFSKMFR
ncbi:MAG: PilZ domain-containing protein [Bdellovibrionales bacterium]|jgi:hypothetical protein|nr:PilZ domain-containing protein [Bdellovibrionales bacterium]